MCKSWIFILAILIFAVSYNFVRFFELVVQVLDNVDNVDNVEDLAQLCQVLQACCSGTHLHPSLVPCCEVQKLEKSTNKLFFETSLTGKSQNKEYQPECFSWTGYSGKFCFSLKQNILFLMSLFKANGKSWSKVLQVSDQMYILNATWLRKHPTYSVYYIFVAYFHFLSTIVYC